MSRKRLTAETLHMGRSRLAAKESAAVRQAAPPRPRPQEPSAHPADENFDPLHAAAVIGDLAEQVRSQLAKDYNARPPGLQTIDNGDGSLVVIADDPAAGLGIQVRIEPLKPPDQSQMQNPASPNMGIGPPPQSAVSSQPAASTPSPSMGIGPSPSPTPPSTPSPSMGIGPPAF
jgi:hypothetical protein